MRRDMHSKAIVFPPDPHKQAVKEQRKKSAHQADEIQFLADCINYQQRIIEGQTNMILNLKTESVEASKATKKPK
jgi:hypothetical protein